MKRMTYALIGFLIFANTVNAQTDTALTFTQVVTLDSSVTAAKAYDRAKLWLNKTFKSAKAVVENDDKEAGIITGKGNFDFNLLIPMGSPGNGYIQFVITLLFKDGKSKIELTDYRHTCLGYGYPSWGLITSAKSSPAVNWPMVGQGLKDKNWKAMQQSSTAVADELIKSYAEHMNKPVNTDW